MTATIDDLEVVPLVSPDGRTMLEARVPRIRRRFRSDLHAVENTTTQMGPWPGELDLVLNRKAPIAQLEPDYYYDGDVVISSAEIRRVVCKALAEGFAGGFIIDAEGLVHGRVALPDRIDDTVDLEALRADYTAWFDAAGVLEVKPRAQWGWEDTVAEELSYAINDLLDRPTWSEHLWELDHYATGTVDGGIKHGLVVGADPARTCAFILSRITDDSDRWWHSLR